MYEKQNILLHKFQLVDLLSQVSIFFPCVLLGKLLLVVLGTGALFIQR